MKQEEEKEKKIWQEINQYHEDQSDEQAHWGT